MQDPGRRPGAIETYVRIPAVDAVVEAISGPEACRRSHICALSRALADAAALADSRPIAICEDDCVFTAEFDPGWAYFIAHHNNGKALTPTVDGGQEWDALVGGLSHVWPNGLRTVRADYHTSWLECLPNSRWAQTFLSNGPCSWPDIVLTQLDTQPEPLDMAGGASGSHCIVYSVGGAIRALACLQEVDKSDNGGGDDDDDVGAETDDDEEGGAVVQQQQQQQKKKKRRKRKGKDEAQPPLLNHRLHADCLLYRDTRRWFPAGMYVIAPYMAYTLTGDLSDLRAEATDTDDDDDGTSDMKDYILPTERRVLTLPKGVERTKALFRMWQEVCLRRHRNTDPPTTTGSGGGGERRGTPTADSVALRFGFVVGPESGAATAPDLSSRGRTDLEFMDTFVRYSERARRDLKAQLEGRVWKHHGPKKYTACGIAACGTCAMRDCPYSCEDHYRHDDKAWYDDDDVQEWAPPPYGFGCPYCCDPPAPDNNTAANPGLQLFFSTLYKYGTAGTMHDPPTSPTTNEHLPVVDDDDDDAANGVPPPPSS